MRDSTSGVIDPRALLDRWKILRNIFFIGDTGGDSCRSKQEMIAEVLENVLDFSVKA